MKMRIVITAVFCMLFLGINAQETTAVSVGDEFTIGLPHNNSYQYLEIPRKNFIIKRGGIANIKSIGGRKVKVVAVETPDGWVRIKRVDGKKFFGAYNTLRARLKPALKQGELVRG